MSLSGNLGFVSLDEVLRLLNRSNQRGLVEVEGDGVGGRVFFDKGVTLATTYGDDELSALIARSGMTEGAPLASLLREMAVETLYQLGAHGTRFEVVEQRTAPITTGAPFELEELLSDTRRRFDEWAEVTSVVTDLDTLIKLRRDLGERDRVTIDRDAWRLVSEVGHGATVRTLARELGTTEFWAAKVAAGMIDEALLELESASSPGAETAEEWTEPSWAEEPTPEPTLTDVPEDAPEESLAPAAGWVESGEGPAEPAEDETTAVFAEAEEQIEVSAPAAETQSVDPNQSWWREPNEGEKPANGEEGDVEEDTEAFLEKVFSGLDSDQPQQGEGYGLLRRRRLGTLRDLSNDS